MKETIQKTREYLDYIERHYDNVQKAWKVVQEKCDDLEILRASFLQAELHFDIKDHDLSKLSAAEFVPYRKRFYPTSKETPGELGDAWNHHLQYNSHHWQTWTKYPDTGGPRLYLDCLHMVVDWIAMSYELGGSAREYYESHKEEIHIPEKFIPFLYEIFDRVYPETEATNGS